MKDREAFWEALFLAWRRTLAVLLLAAALGLFLGGGDLVVGRWHDEQHQGEKPVKGDEELVLGLTPRYIRAAERC